MGEPAEVEGTAGEWIVDPEALSGDFEGRTALLSPFDRLIHDRVRAQELFDFEYTLEMYKPAATRRWGYFALPILHGDRLIGKLDADGRPQGVDPPRQCGPRGRPLHASAAKGRGRRDRRARRVARPRAKRRSGRRVALEPRPRATRRRGLRPARPRREARPRRGRSRARGRSGTGPPAVAYDYAARRD